jgi:hypothetical protein
MNSEDYAKIGKKLKADNPGRWEGNTDEEVGVVHVKATALQIPEIEIDLRTHVSKSLSLNEKPLGFLGIRINNLDKQIRHIGLQSQRELAVENARFAYDHHSQNLEQQHRLQTAQYILSMLDARQKAELTQLATAHELDNSSYLTWRLAELNVQLLDETNRIQAENTARLNQIELDKLERQKLIEHEHEQRQFHAKVGSAVDYANTAHLIWMRKNEDLKRLYKQVDDVGKDTELSETTRARTLGRLEKQIKKLEGELDGPSGEAVSPDSGA